MKVFKYLFISSIMFAVTSCGNDWLDLAPSTQVDTETSINVLSGVVFRSVEQPKTTRNTQA